MATYVYSDDAPFAVPSGVVLHYAVEVEATAIALQNIRERWGEKGKLGATGEEMAALELYAQEAADFWPRQAARIYRNAYERVRTWKRAAVTEARARRAAA
jgi:hypothetical protein